MRSRSEVKTRPNLEVKDAVGLKSKAKMTMHDIHLAIKLRSIADVSEILLRDTSLDVDQCLFGTTALSLSLYYQCDNAFDLILDRHVQTAPVNLDQLSFDPQRRHEPALVTAVRLANQPAVCRLLDCGANIEAVDGFGHTALWTAARERRFDLAVTLLCHGATVCRPSLQRAASLPVFAASRLSSRRTDLTKLMIVAGADSRSVDGQSLLTRLLAPGRYHVIRLLLSACHVSRPSQSTLTTGDADIDTLVSEHFHHVPTLVTQCRWTVRRAVCSATMGRHFIPALSWLPLPKPLSDYVMLMDVLSEDTTLCWKQIVHCLMKSGS